MSYLASLVPRRPHSPNIPELTDMFRRDRAEEKQKQKEANAQEAFNKTHTEVYKFVLPIDMEATRKKMLYSPALQAFLTEQSSDYVHTIM